MKFPRTVLFAAISIVATASVARAQAGMNDLEIAHAAYTADLIDIEYAKIALSKTKSAEVKTFAELMIRRSYRRERRRRQAAQEAQCRGQGQ